MRLLALAALLASSTAVAGPGVRVAAELGASYVTRDDRANDLTWVAPSLAVRAMYGEPEGLAVGLRVGASRLGFARAKNDGSANVRDAERYGDVPIDLAAAAQYGEAARWVALWLGWRLTRVGLQKGVQIIDEDYRFESSREIEIAWASSGIAAGVTGGYDLWRRGGSRVGGFAEMSVGPREHGDKDRYITITLGVAYRR